MPGNGSGGVTIISPTRSTMEVLANLVELINVTNAWLFKADRMVACADEYKAFRAKVEEVNKFLHD